MKHDTTGTEGTVALPPVTSPSLLPRRLAPAAAWLRAVSERQLGARSGYVALGAIAFGALVTVAFATGGSSILVPRSAATFPHWEAGPLRQLFSGLSLSPSGIRTGDTLLLFAMTGAYGAALLAARSVSMRAVVWFALGVNLILFLGPPLQLNDVWNYLGYARLGALHHLNPYTTTMRAESNDPIFTFATWHHLSSPYGPLFTALSYPLAFLPISIAYWVLKAALVLASLAFLWIVDRCARLLGRDRRVAVLFVAANPIYIFWAVGGFHNDLVVLAASMGSVALLLGRRDRAAGAALMVAVALKPSAIVLLPFLLIAARPPDRRLRVLGGVLAAAVPLAALWIGLFGHALPNLKEQSSLITSFSIPNLTGLTLGFGGSTTTIVRGLNVALVLVVLWGLRRRDWVAAAGWSTLALVATLSWLMPWYVVWVLPLAAVAGSRRLRLVAVAFTAYLVLAFVPATGPFVSEHGIRLMQSPSDGASLVLQSKLQN